jgi:methionyl-tRNA synthetase
MIQVNVKCPHCGKSFMDDEVKIDGQPSVRLNVQWGGERGRIRLSSLYGSYKIEMQLSMPEGEIAKFFCPHCNAELTAPRICERCDAPMVSMKFIEGGTVEICSRKGCKKHLIEFEDLETELRAFYEKYSLFFKSS